MQASNLLRDQAHSAQGPLYGITPLASDNYEYIQRRLNALPGHVDSYLDCALYYIVTLRAGGWMIEANGNLLFAGLHPHDESVVLLFPERSQNATFQTTWELLKSGFFGAKKISLARFPDKETQAFSRHTGVFLESHVDRDMDWVFPIHVLNTADAAAMQGSKFVKIRNKVRRARTAVRRIETVDHQPHAVLQDAYSLWCERMRHIAGASFDGAAEYYAASIDLLRRHPHSMQGIAALDEEDRVVGATFWSTPRSGRSNLYINVCEPSIVGLSDYLLTEACAVAGRQGTVLLNLGGSEIGSLNEFKQKYDPAHSLVARSYFAGPLPAGRREEQHSAFQHLQLIKKD